MQQKEVLIIVGVLAVGFFLLNNNGMFSGLSGRSVYYNNLVTHPQPYGGGTSTGENLCGCPVIDGVSDATQQPSADNPYGGWHQVYGILVQNLCDSRCGGFCVYQSVGSNKQYPRPCMPAPECILNPASECSYFNIR